MSAEKLAYSAHEAAELVGVSESTIHRLIANGVLRRVPDTSRVLIARVVLEAWVASTTAAAS